MCARIEAGNDRIEVQALVLCIVMHFAVELGLQDLVVECEIKGLVMNELCANGPINLRIGHILHAIKLLGSSIRHIIYSWLYLYIPTSIEASN